MTSTLSIYKKKAIILCRISSTKQNEGESHEDQEKACRFVGDRYEAIIVRIWKETLSGRKNQRPVFDEILEYVDKHKDEIDYCFIRAIDRFTRLGAAGYETMKKELAKRDVELIDTYGIIQPPKNTLEHLGFKYSWSMQSPSEITELVVAQTGKTEITNMLTRMIGQEIRLTQEGYKIGRPDDGFINKRIFVDGKKKMIQIPDPGRSHFYEEMLTLRAPGIYSDKEIVDKINAKGFRTKRMNKWNADHTKIIATIGGKLLTVKQLQRIIRRPIYAGVSCKKWTNYQPIKAKYEGIVSIETFNQANRGKVFIKECGNNEFQILYDYSPYGTKPRRLKNNPLYSFKFILCSHCRKPFLGSSPKGKMGKRFPTYHCSRGHKYYGVGKNVFEDGIRKLIRGLRLHPKFFNYLEVSLLDKYRGKEKEITQNSAHISSNIAELKIQKASALDALVAIREPTIRVDIEQRVIALQQQIDNAEQERGKVDITEKDIHDFIAYGKHLMEHLEELLMPKGNSTNLHTQRALFSLVFEEMPTYQDILNGTPKLSLIFQLSSDFHDGKSLSVGEARLELPRGIILKGF